MGVFMVVRAGAALVSRISQMLVSYRWAPTMVPSSYLVQMTDAGSVPCSTTIYKGSDSLRALFFWHFPGEVCRCAAGGHQPKRPKSATFSARAVSVLRLVCGWARMRFLKNKKLRWGGSLSTKATSTTRRCASLVLTLHQLI